MSKRRGAARDAELDGLYTDLSNEQTAATKIQAKAKEILKKYSAGHHKIKTDAAKNAITDATDLTNFNHYVQEYNNRKSVINEISTQINEIQSEQGSSKKLSKTSPKSKTNKQLNFNLDANDYNLPDYVDSDSEEEENKKDNEMEETRESGELNSDTHISPMNKTLSMQSIWDKKMNSYIFR